MEKQNGSLYQQKCRGNL